MLFFSLAVASDCCLCFCFAVIFLQRSSSPTPKKASFLSAYCLRNKKNMKRKTKKIKTATELMLFSCVVAQNIKQHSEELSAGGEEEVGDNVL